VRALKVIREPGIGWVVPQGGLQSVGRGASLRNEPADGYPVTGDDDSLAVLNGIENAGEASRRLCGVTAIMEYILSDLVCIYISEPSRRPTHREPPREQFAV